jgi:hypothetical protein
MHITMDIDPYFQIADSDRTYIEKLVEYEKLADAHLDSETFHEFCETHLRGLDEVMWELMQSDEIDNMLVQTVKSMFPPHEHEHFIAHFRGLIQHWVDAEARS